jgi:transposase
MDVAIGVDSHKKTLEVAALDRAGRSLGGRRFRNDPKGLTEFEQWLDTLPHSRVVGIECSGTFGSSLARRLLSRGEDVREVPGNLSYGEANLRSKGKTDPTDAEAIARVALREPNLPRAKDGTNEDLRLLSQQRDRLVLARTKEQNRIHGHMTLLVPGYESAIGSVKKNRNLAVITKLLRADRTVRADIVRDGIEEIRRLNRTISKVEARIRELLKTSGTSLQTATGIGDMIAAKILGEVGDPAQLRSAAGFARLSGVAPIPASSGSTVRHRHYRGGNRRLNHAIHMVAVVRCRLDPDTKKYMAKKRAEGKTGKEAMRCLKRHIANDIYRRLMAELQPKSLI